jgi:hypothetical protein
MKRLAIVVAIMIGWVAVAFAAMQNDRQKASVKTEKHRDCNEKKECTHICPYSS